jgi:hypothetical protein
MLSKEEEEGKEILLQLLLINFNTLQNRSPLKRKVIF